MNSVYDVIDVLRTWRGFTMRELATRSGISYTTLISIMKRRPEKMAKNTLARIAGVFRAEWYELLGIGPSAADTPYHGRNSNGERIDVMMDEYRVEAVLREILGERYEAAIEKLEKQQKELQDSQKKRLEQREQGWVISPYPYLKNHDTFEKNEKLRRKKLRGQLGVCVDLAFDNLNDAGVIEAMRYILELAQNPKYKKTDEQNEKEDIE